MNLSAKSVGQLLVLAVVLFFFSCEDPNSLLGLKNPNKKFNVTYVDLPLESSVEIIDSVITDNKGSQSSAGASVLVGKYFDNLLGEVTAKAFVQVIPQTLTALGFNAVYDSATIQFRLNFYAYGFTGTRQEKFTIHETTDSLSVFSSKRYYYKDAFNYNSNPVGEASVTVKYDSLVKQSALTTTTQDTLLATAKLSDDLGRRLFIQASTGNFTSSDQFKQFIYDIKGLALIPSSSGAILGLKILDGLSHITIHYHTIESGAVKDTLSRNFTFNTPSFTNFHTERGASELGAYPPYVNFQPASGSRYVQGGTPVISKLDMNKFYQFADADTNKNILINSAELVIKDVSSPPGFKSHSSLSLKLMKGEQFFNYNVDADSTGIVPYNSTTSSLLNVGNHFYVKSEYPSNPPAVTSLLYDPDKSQYSTFITNFAQALFKYRNVVTGFNPARIPYLAVVPLNPAVSSSVNRTVFGANSVSLRIFYTRPSSSTNPN